MKKFNRLVILVFLAGVFFPSFSQTSENYYITFAHEPWDNSSNSAAMTDAFGDGNWARRYFTDTDLASLFTSPTKFIFVDGSAGVTEQFNLFLQDHKDAFTAWVSDGGRLFINCGADAEQNFGFDGTLTNEGISTLPESKAGHVVGPILAQPYDLTSQVDYTGAEFSHAKVSGAGLRPLITSADGTAVVLADKIHGDGLLLFGGLTTSNFHKPQPQAQQLRTNIFYYAAHFGYTVAPEANFTTSTSDLYIHHSTILSSDASSGYVAARTWQITPETFEYVNGTNQHSYRPVIKFRETGTYSVTLTVSNELGEDSETKENYITVQNRRNFYWVGGGGYWGSPEHWATSSGGSEFYDEVPTRGDNVIFDENSFSADGQEVFLGGGNFELFDFTISGTTHAPEFTDGTFFIYGATTVSSPATFSVQKLEFRSEDRVTIDLTNATLVNTGIRVFGKGTFDFISPIVSKWFYPDDGTIYTHGHTITTPEFGAEGGSATIWFQNSELHVTENFYMYSDIDAPFKDGVNLFLGTSEAPAYFVLQEETFKLNEVTLTGEILIYDDMPSEKITFMPGVNADLRGHKMTAEIFMINGTADGPVTIADGAFSKAFGTVVAEYVQLTNVIAAGGATFYADKNSVDNGGNTGWIFSTKETQDITIAAIPDKVYGAEPFPITATSSSGLPVTISVASGPATVSESLVTITGAGTIIFQAQQGGDGTFLPAQDVVQSLTVARAPQEIVFASIPDKTFGDAAFNVSATGGISGNPVVFAVTSGPATIAGSTVTLNGAGMVTIEASQAGSANYLDATVEQTFSVAKATQAITFNTISDKTFGDAAFDITATGGASGNPVVFSVTSGAATIEGSTVTLQGAGTVTIVASQAGGANYVDVEAEQMFSVAKATQEIVFNTIPDKTFGTAFNITATGGESGNPVVLSVTSGPATISGNTVTLQGVGTVTIKASQAGSANYLDAIVVEQTFSVAKATQAIAFNSIADKTFGDAAFDVTAIGGESGNPVVFAVTSGPATIEGNTITLNGAGTVIIEASQAGSANYLDAIAVEQTFSVAKAMQEITFNSIPDKTFGDAAFDITATGGASGNPVVFAVTLGQAIIEGSTVTLTGPGPVTLSAFQPGNDNYIEAIAEQTFCVNPAKPVVTVTGSDSGIPVLTSTAGEGYQWYNNGTAISGANGETHTATEAGIYTVTVNASHCVSVPSDAHVLIVTSVEGTHETIVKAYPNPVVNELIVDVTAVNAHQEISVTLYDVSGRLMTTTKGRGVVSIPMQSYRSGQYTLAVHFGMQQITKQILKK